MKIEDSIHLGGNNMKLDTRIVIPVRYNSDYECDTCLKVIDGMLYNVAMGARNKVYTRREDVIYKGNRYFR